MSRNTPDRIKARVQDNGAPQSPTLRVQQDMNVGGRELWAVAEALSAFSSTVPANARARRDQQDAKDRADYEEGKLQRLQSSLVGDADAAVLQAPDISSAFRRGYLESEGAVQLARFKNELTADVAKLGPDDDFEKYVHEKTSTWMEANSSADPAIRKTLIPGLTRVVDAARGQFQQQSMKEILSRQQENLFALAVEGVKDGSMLTADGRAKLYDFAARPEMGALERREVDPLVASAFAEQLASGSVDPTKVLAELEAPRADGTPGIAHNPKFREDLVRAAARGQAQIDEARHAAEKQHEADIAFKLDDLAERGILSDRAIKEAASQVGKGDDASWQLTWRNRNQAAQKRLASEAEARKEKRDIMALLVTGDARVNALPKDKVLKTIDEGVLSAMDNKDDRALGAVLRVAEMNGVAPSLLKNQFEKIDPRTPAQFSALVAQFEKIEANSPTYARRIVDEKGLAKIDAYRRLVRENGLRPEAAIDTLANSAVDLDDARRAVSFAWNQSQKYLPRSIDVPWWFDKTAANPGYIDQWVRRNAETYYATGQFSAEDAVKKASDVFKERHVVVNGRYVPNVGFKPGAPEAADDFVSKVKDAMVKGGYATDDDSFFIGPTIGTTNREDGKMAVYWANDGMPVTDPKTRQPLLVDLNVIADEYGRSKAESEQKRIREEQDKRQRESQMPRGALLMDTRDTLTGLGARGQ